MELEIGKTYVCIRPERRSWKRLTITGPGRLIIHTADNPEITNKERSYSQALAEEWKHDYVCDKAHILNEFYV